MIHDLEVCQRARMEEGSWRQQSEAQLRGDFGPVPPTIVIPGDFTTTAPPPEA